MPHKRSHMFAAVDAGTGVLVAELEIRADEDGHRRKLRWARALAGERVWRSRTAAGSRAAWSRPCSLAASALCAFPRS
jgi:hypothetical protein